MRRARRIVYLEWPRGSSLLVIKLCSVERKMLVKGAADRVVAALLLVVLAPLLLGIAVALHQAGRPVLDRHDRVGLGGRRFRMLTFRPTGRPLLDAIPQLFNVLGGSMSLVGPRPPRPDEVPGEWRLTVKPGVTGLWQACGRDDLSWDESAELDRCYAQSWSVAVDAQILWRTFRTAVAQAQQG